MVYVYVRYERGGKNVCERMESGESDNTRREKDNSGINALAETRCLLFITYVRSLFPLFRNTGHIQPLNPSNIPQYSVF